MSTNPLTPASSTPAPAPSQGGAGVRLTPIDPMRVVRQHLRLLLLTFLVGLILGIGVWWLLRRYAPQYETKARLVVMPGLDDPYSSPAETGNLSDQRLEMYAAIIANQIELLTSDDVLDRTLQNPDVRKTSWFQNAARERFSLNDVPGIRNGSTVPSDSEAARTHAAREAIEEALSASQVRGSTLIAVSLRGRFSGDLPIVLDALITAYLDVNQRQSEAAQFGVRTAMNREFDEANREYKTIEANITAFVKENDMPNVTIRGSEATIAYEDISSQLSTAEMRLSQSRNMLTALDEALREGRISASPDELAMVQSDPAVQSRDERLRQLREQRDVYLDRFGEKHRQVRELDMQLEAVQQEKQREIERLLRERAAVQLEQTRKLVASSEANALDLRTKLDATARRLRDMAGTKATFDEMQRALTAAGDRRDRARKMLDDLRVRRSRPDSVPVSVMLKAGQATLEFPDPAPTILAVAMGLLAIVTSLVFLRELVDQRIKAPYDMQLLPASRLVGVVPAASEDKNAKGDIQGVVRRHPQGLVAEAFRGIRTNLLEICGEHSHKAIMFVGAHADSGTSSTVANLATSLAMHGSRVLVIDADIRRPVQHRLLGATQGPGLVEVVAGSVAFSDAVQRPGDSDVDVLIAGDVRGSSPELLEQSSFRTLLEATKQKYDIVLIDTPPALLTSESSMLSRVVDGSVVVVRAMHDKRGTVARLLRQLGDQPAEVLGVVINDLRASHGGYLKRNYQAYYAYQGDRPRTSGAAT